MQKIFAAFLALALGLGAVGCTTKADADVQAPAGWTTKTRINTQDGSTVLEATDPKTGATVTMTASQKVERSTVLGY